MMLSIRNLVWVSLVLLAGCQNQANESSGANAAGSPTIEAKASPGLTVSPGTLSACDPGSETLVQWDANASGSPTDGVELWVGAGQEDAKLFAAGGATGEARTGPWARPGTHFVLKNKNDGKVIAEATVGGPVCK